MKTLSLIFTLFYTTILISCQNSKKDLDFIKEIKLPYTIEIRDYDKFVHNSFEKKEVYDYNNLTNTIGKHTNISKIYFIGKFLVGKQEFVLYQDVSPNESADFFPAIYLTKTGKNIKTLCLTPTNEESYIDKITINDNKIILRENYWDSEEKKRKNNKIKEYNFDFNEIEEIKLSRIEKDNKYSIISEKEADINQDGKLDQITVFSTQWNKEITPSDSKLFKVVVKLSNNENRFTTLTNDNIIEPYYPENVASGFSDIKIKDNYFTVEQANGGGGIINRSFITFKYDKIKKGIYLHRYSILTTEMSSGDEKESKTELTTKDFGLIPFEKFNTKIIDSK